MSRVNPTTGQEALHSIESRDVVDFAIEEWRQVLGAEGVATEATATAPFEQATFQLRRRVPAVLKPANRDQVQEIMRIATRHRVPVYPVSSGKNWGYGSAVAAATGCAMLDLSRMNRIIDFNENLAYVTVEPGVTQQQLFDFLQQRGSRLWIDATGATPESSLIGNTVERGFGHTPYSDHFANCCGLEVVLPNGEMLNTGFARIPGATTAPVYKWGVGPYLDGLFTQSNLGIVTRMTVWLMPAPEHTEAFFFRCDGPADLGPLIDALAPLRLNGTLKSAVHVGNGYKVLSGLRQYPWEHTGGETPLSKDKVRELAKTLNFGLWNGSGALYGTKVQVREAKRLLKKALGRRVTRLQFLDDRMLNLATRFAKPLSWLTRWDLSKTLELVKPLYGLLKGQPTAVPVNSTYWRKRTPPPANGDPDRDRCGLLWCSHTAPTMGAHAERMMEITERVALHYGFEPIVSITLLTERTICSVLSLSYDRDVEGEDQRALECYRELMHELSAAGYPPYRLGVQSAYALPGESGYQDFVKGIKKQLDPHGVLAPGRYIR